MDTKGMSNPTGPEDDSELYADMLLLEELESLLEDLDEHETGVGGTSVPEHIEERLTAYNLSGSDDLRRQVRDLHTRLDRRD